MKISVLKLDWNINRVSTVCLKIVIEKSDFLQLRLIRMRYFFANVYLTGFFKTWLKKFKVHFNFLTSKWNGKQLKVTG